MCLSTKKGQEKIENFTFNSPDVAAGVPIQVAVDRPRHAALVEQQRRAAAVSTAGGISCINRRASAHGFVRLGRAAVIRQRSQQRIARERRATGTIFDQVVGIGADASSVGSTPPHRWTAQINQQSRLRVERLIPGARDPYLKRSMGEDRSGGSGGGTRKPASESCRIVHICDCEHDTKPVRSSRR